MDNSLIGGKSPQAEIVEPKELAEAYSGHYRPGTGLPREKVSIVLTKGGIGDYINWTPAVRKLLRECPHNKYRLFAPAFFIELARYFFPDLADRGEIYLREQYKKYGWPNSPALFPNDFCVNATGWHLMDLGFMYFGNRAPHDEELYYPTIEKRERQLLKDYVVLTTGATSPMRSLTKETIEGIITWLRNEGLEVVLLGKHYMTDGHKAHFEEFDKGDSIDLREKTTLLEAANIMAHSRATVGLDNGLLHLAACTEAPLVFGYTVAHPEHRRPRRKEGKIVDVVPDSSLECRFCQSNMRYVYYDTKQGQKVQVGFKSCFYGDNMCTQQLTADKFIAAIKEIL